MRSKDQILLENLYEEVQQGLIQNIKNIMSYPQELKDIFNKYGYVESEDVNREIAVDDDINGLVNSYITTKNPDNLKQLEAIFQNRKNAREQKVVPDQVQTMSSPTKIPSLTPNI
jgi:predicted nucleotidyltransferase